MNALLKLTSGAGFAVFYRREAISIIKPSKLFGWFGEVDGSWITTVDGGERFVLENPEEVAVLMEN